MNKMFSLMLAGFVGLSVGACTRDLAPAAQAEASTKEKSAQEKFTEVKEEHSKAVKELNEMGVPQADWSQAQINKFLEALRKISDIEADIASNGKSDYNVVLVDDNSDVVSAGQLLVNQISMAQGIAQFPNMESAHKLTVNRTELVAYQKKIAEMTSLLEAIADLAKEDEDKSQRINKTFSGGDLVILEAAISRAQQLIPLAVELIKAQEPMIMDLMANGGAGAEANFQAQLENNKKAIESLEKLVKENADVENAVKTALNSNSVSEAGNEAEESDFDTESFIGRALVLAKTAGKIGEYEGKFTPVNQLYMNATVEEVNAE